MARLLAWTREYLAGHGIESPRLCAEILLAHAMGCERIHLFTRHESEPEEAVRVRFRALVREAATGRPIAHLIGGKEFFALPFEVTPDVLIPRPETEILVERTIDLARKEPEAVRRILDVGTGSGCIAVSLARHLPEVKVYASDVSAAALAVAERNAARHAVAERIEFRAGDLFAPWDEAPLPGAFDIIVSNPPYVGTQGAPLDPHVRAYEPHLALFGGVDGLAVIRRLLAEAPRRLRTGGHLLMEVAFDQAARVRDLLSEKHWDRSETYRDGGGHERVVHMRRTAVDQVQVA